MSKLAVVLLVSGIAAVPIFGKTNSPENMVLAYGEITQTYPIDIDQTVFTVTSSIGASCQIVSLQSKQLTSGVQDGMAVRPDSSCAGVSHELALVTKLIKSPHGNDTLTDATGKTILLLSPSDGFAYEAIDKNGVQISFEVNGI